MSVVGFVNPRASTVESVSSSVAAKATEMDQPHQGLQESSLRALKQPKPILAIEFDDEKDEMTTTDLIFNTEPNIGCFR